MGRDVRGPKEQLANHDRVQVVPGTVETLFLDAVISACHQSVDPSAAVARPAGIERMPCPCGRRGVQYSPEVHGKVDRIM